MPRHLPIVQNVLRILPRDSVDEVARDLLHMSRPHQFERDAVIASLLESGDSPTLRQTVFAELGRLLGFSSDATVPAVAGISAVVSAVADSQPKRPVGRPKGSKKKIQRRPTRRAA